jgi:hypothetical protein
MEQIRELMAKHSSQNQQEVLDSPDTWQKKKANLNAKSYGSTGQVDWPSSMKVIHLWNCRKNPWIGGAIELPHRFKDIM